MTQNDKSERRAVAALCLKCKHMWGSPSFDYMCSQCFKKQKQQKYLDLLMGIKKQQEEAAVGADKVSTGVKLTQSVASKCEEIVAKSQNVKHQTVTGQPDKQTGKCMRCKKRTGILGYPCKHCTFEYCKLHRLPQEHDCEVDFVTLGRKKIKSQNPVVIQKKIEHI